MRKIRSEDVTFEGERDIETVEENLSRLDTYLEEYDIQKILEYLAVEASLSAFASKISSYNDGLCIPPSMHKLILGKIYYSEKIDGKKPRFKKLVNITQDLQESHTFQTVESSKNKKEKEIEAMHSQRQVTTGRFVLSEQPIIAAKKAYTPHNEQMKRILGFKIEDAIKFSKKLTSILNKIREKFIRTSSVSPEDVAIDESYASATLKEMKENEEFMRTKNSDYIKMTTDIVERAYRSGGKEILMGA